MIEQLVDTEHKSWTCCGGALHIIGGMWPSDSLPRTLSEVLPATFRVLVTSCPRYGCRSCEAPPVEAPAPARIVEGGLPTER